MKEKAVFARCHTVWITGASSGLGEACAYELAEVGRNLVLSGRSRSRLERVASTCRARGAQVVVLPFDVADGNERDIAWRELGDYREKIDLLINNAGVSQRGYARESNVAVDRRVMEVNFLSAVELTKRVLPAMEARGSGRIVTVSSVAALAPVPLRSAYNAAKAAQIAFFSTLRNEQAHRGIQVQLVIPGFVRTRVSQNALLGDGSASGVLDPNQASGCDPVRAARAMMRDLERGKARVYIGMTFSLWAMVILSRIAPRLLDYLLRRVRVR